MFERRVHQISDNKVISKCKNEKEATKFPLNKSITLIYLDPTYAHSKVLLTLLPTSPTRAERESG